MGRSKRSKNLRKHKKKQQRMTAPAEKTYLVALYDGFRKNGKEHKKLDKENIVFLGNYYSEPVYDLQEIHYDAALRENGSTSILFEIYEVEESTLKILDDSIGYEESLHSNNPDENTYNYYNRKKIRTPYGLAFVYFYNDEGYSVPKDAKKILSGDWIDYIDSKTFESQITLNT